jgi:tRNA A37 threonylcarbamoyladenosine synthetase subunit TsaC/SUA5/YrdC
MIIQELGSPLLSSSLKDNDDIIEYATDPELIYEQYQDKVNFVVDGGYGDIIPSTVVDLTGDEFEIIRQGKGELS